MHTVHLLSSASPARCVLRCGLSPVADQHAARAYNFLLFYSVCWQLTQEGFNAVLLEHIAQRIFPPVTVSTAAAAAEATASAAGAGSAAS